MNTGIFKRFASTFIAVLIGSVIACAQDGGGEKWVQIIDGDGLISFSVPDDFLVDKDSRLEFRVIAFNRGVTFEVEADRFGGAGTVFNNLKPRKNESQIVLEFPPTSKKEKAAKVKQFASDDMTSYRIYVNSGERYYRIYIRSISSSEPSLPRILGSILINGNPLEGSGGARTSAAESLIAKELKTSQEIKDARSKKEPKRTDTYSYFPIEAFKPVASLTDATVRRAIVVENKPPMLLAFSPGEHKVKVVAEFQANGLIGNVVVYSNVPEKLIANIIESALGVKFVPAKKGADYIDSVQVIDYSVNVGKPIIQYGMPRMPPLRF